MALLSTAGFSGKNGTKFQLNLYYDVIAQDVANNTSTIRYTLYWKSLGYSGSGSKCTGYINGVAVGTASSISANENKLMGTLDVVVQHNADGTFPTTAFSALIDTPWTLGDASTSGNLTSASVATIPRASSITVTDGYINDATHPVIHINAASSTFTHTLRYSFGGLSGTIWEKYQYHDFGWTLPESFYTQIPQAKEGTGTVYCDTYSGDTLVGTSAAGFTVRTKESVCKPDVSATITDTGKVLGDGVTKTTDLTGSNTKFIKGVSDALVNITATPKYSASINTIVAACGDGQSGSGASQTFRNIGSGQFTIYATDSRVYPDNVGYVGYTNPTPMVVEMIDYVPLTLNQNVYRPEPTTGEIILNVQGNYYKGSFGKVNNSLVVKYRYKETSQSWDNVEYKTLTVNINNNNTYSLEISLGKTFDYQKSYDFEVVATDKVKTQTRNYRVAEGIPMLALFKSYIEMFGVDAFKTLNNKLSINDNILIGNSGKTLASTNKLVKEFELQNETNGFRIDLSDTDIEADGYIWDIYFEGTATTETVLSMFINDRGSNTQQIIEGTGTSVIASAEGGASRIGTISGYSTFVTIHISKSKYSNWTRVIANGGHSYKINNCISETDIGGKLNALSFMVSSGTFHAGTIVRIYRR